MYVLARLELPGQPFELLFKRGASDLNVGRIGASGREIARMEPLEQPVTISGQSLIADCGLKRSEALVPVTVAGLT
jgi:hypothetical protein